MNDYMSKIFSFIIKIKKFLKKDNQPIHIILKDSNNVNINITISKKNDDVEKKH